LLARQKMYKLDALSPLLARQKMYKLDALSPLLARQKMYKLDALSPLGERVDRDGAFTSRRGPGEGVVGLRSSVCSSHRAAKSIGQRPCDVQHLLEKPGDSVGLFVVSGH